MPCFYYSNVLHKVFINLDLLAYFYHLKRYKSINNSCNIQNMWVWRWSHSNSHIGQDKKTYFLLCCASLPHSTKKCLPIKLLEDIGKSYSNVIDSILLRWNTHMGVCPSLISCTTTKRMFYDCISIIKISKYDWRGAREAWRARWLDLPITDESLRTPIIWIYTVVGAYKRTKYAFPTERGACLD